MPSTTDAPRIPGPAVSRYTQENPIPAERRNKIRHRTVREEPLTVRADFKTFGSSRNRVGKK
jgi:hypothetical protein